jgi:hypothetical protein
MNRSIIAISLAASFGLAACDRPTVVNPPPVVVTVPGPAGPAGPQGEVGSTGSAGTQGNQGNDGARGNTGSTGSTGSTGKAGDGTTVIVVSPSASAAGQ